ncbi:MAG TPA: hypothetical protein VII06_09460 [Chloroflexota bacterium]|jgi:hypothetical protein
MSELESWCLLHPWPGEAYVYQWQRELAAARAWLAWVMALLRAEEVPGG